MAELILNAFTILIIGSTVLGIVRGIIRAKDTIVSARRPKK